MSKHLVSISTLVVGLSLPLGTLQAQSSQTPQTPTSTRPNSTPARTGVAGADAQFLRAAAEGGQAEVELADLAQSQSQNADVKSLAAKIKSDHMQANTELKSLASQKSFTLPAAPSAAQKATKDRLSKLNGAAFDKAYVDEMVKDHQQDIAEFQKEAKSADADVKAFAEKTLPALKGHLEQAQNVQRQIK